MIAQSTPPTELKILAARQKLPTWFGTIDMAEAARICRASASLYMRRMERAGRLEKGDRIWTSPKTSYHLYRFVDVVPVVVPKPKPAPRNLFEAIIQLGHDEDWNPVGDSRFVGTGAPPGSNEKIEVLRRRVELGHPLWHPDDRVDYHGCTGEVPPK
jgi:hypothetical protein